MPSADLNHVSAGSSGESLSDERSASRAHLDLERDLAARLRRRPTTRLVTGLVPILALLAPAAASARPSEGFPAWAALAARDADGENPHAELARGDQLARAGRIEEALEIFAALARRHPRSESPRLAAGNALLAAGRIEEAIVELEAAARVAPRPAAILNGLARIYLDPRIGRPADALSRSRAARRLEPWREETYFLQARAYEGLGQQEAARQTYQVLLTNFPSGHFRDQARRGLDRLSRVTYEVALQFRFANRGSRKAERIHLRVQAAQDFPPYSEARLVELPPEAKGLALPDGTRYFGFDAFSLDPGEERTFRMIYAVGVSADAYRPAGDRTEGGEPQRWLAPSPFIESDAPEIVSLAQALASSGAPYERAHRFYEFVLKRLTYVVQEQTLGALGALARPGQADCTEFAALFIALSRASGIPARPVFGYLYEPSKPRYEISHLWAEFWDPDRGWVTADPTNGSLAPERYFGRVESDYIPLWIPSSAFGDLAGVKVSYQSPGEDDALFTELAAEIRPLPPSEFEAAPDQQVVFAAAPLDDPGGLGDALPLGPAAALCVLLGLAYWQSRRRPA